MEDCIECLGNPDSVLAANCKVAFGECGHAYHFHCIHKWLEKANGTNQCPMVCLFFLMFRADSLYRMGRIGSTPVLPIEEQTNNSGLLMSIHAVKNKSLP